MSFPFCINYKKRYTEKLTHRLILKVISMYILNISLTCLQLRSTRAVMIKCLGRKKARITCCKSASFARDFPEFDYPGNG